MQEGDNEDAWFESFANAVDLVPRATRRRTRTVKMICDCADEIYGRMKDATKKDSADAKKKAPVIQLKS